MPAYRNTRKSKWQEIQQIRASSRTSSNASHKKPNWAKDQPASWLPKMSTEKYVTIYIEWPVGQHSADPNHFYRQWLEDNVGVQDLDWNWYVDVNDSQNMVLYFKNEKDAFSFLMVKDQLKKLNDYTNYP